MKIAVGILLILIALYWLGVTIRTGTRTWWGLLNGIIFTIGFGSVGIILLLGGSWLSILWGATFAFLLVTIVNSLLPSPIPRHWSVVFVYLFALALIVATILTWGIKC